MSVLTEQPTNFEEKGFWFGINNLALNNGNTVASIYFGVSSKYSPSDDNWVSSLEHYPNSRNYNSDIMATIYQLAYSKTNLGNKAEYPLCLAYGLKIAEKSMDYYKKTYPQKRVGYAVGFDSGDFFDMGWV